MEEALAGQVIVVEDRHIAVEVLPMLVSCQLRMFVCSFQMKW